MIKLQSRWSRLHEPPVAIPFKFGVGCLRCWELRLSFMKKLIAFDIALAYALDSFISGLVSSGTFKSCKIARKQTRHNKAGEGRGGSRSFR